ncbi:amino acid adenylation domain-containing protein [Nannocystis sp. ILAH1]|nr:non-ribosomal peptide synthetase [Nannocystis sp. ILAH1]MCY0989534.1 amino acid adenylation domain-containing protein [Nannocystis sp. ILAH1]
MNRETRASELVRARLLHEAIQDVRPARAAQRRACADEAVCSPAASHLVWAVRIRGPVDVAALQRAWEALVLASTPLRSVLREHMGRLEQVTYDASAVTFERSAAPVTEVDDLARFARDLASTRFDHPRGFPWRNALVWDNAESAHALVVVQHGAMCDAWSIHPQMMHLARSYCPEPGVHAPASPSAATARLVDEPGAQRFWRERLAGLDELSLPREGLSRAGGGDASTSAIDCSPALSLALERTAADLGVSPLALVMATYIALLHRYTAQTDLAIPALLPGPGSGLAAGCSARTAVIRCRLTRELPFAALARQVARELDTAEPHASDALDDIVRWLGPGTARGADLFPARFVWAPAVGDDIEVAGTRWRARVFMPDGSVEGSSAHDLRLGFGPVTGGGLGGLFVYRPGSVSPTVGARMGEHFALLLRAAAFAPATPVARLPLIGEEERRLLLDSWNDTRRPAPIDTPFHVLFEAEVRRGPGRIAVSAGQRSLTYVALDRLADRIARRLRALGIGRDHTVGLLMARGVDLLACIVGIFKAGGAYVPIDPALPPARQRHIVRSSGCPVLIVGSAAAAGLEEGVEPGERLATAIYPLAEFLAEHAEDDPGYEGCRSAGAAATDLAYVIYTSGSTGAPKGAMVEQRGMVNHLHAKIDSLSLGGADVVAQSAAQSFDIAIWQFLAPLLAGARVEIVADEQARDPAALLSLVRDRKISVLEVVPSQLGALLDYATAAGVGPDQLASLRWLLATGEALSAELCRRWLELFPRIPLVNAYGPTECSDDVAHHTVRAASDLTGPEVPIGRPLHNTRLYVLDAELAPVPIGVAGELCVAGVCVGRGYLGAPGETARAFLDHPLAGRGRLYRTGDRVRYTARGELIFLGRRDDQVKIRGYRIELDEVSAALAAHAAVRDAAVVVRRDATREPQLVAFWTARGRATAEELAAHMAERLPPYMLPAHIHRVDALPLTPSGKVDRRALARRTLEDRPASPPEDDSHPRTPVEEIVCHVWANILGRETVGLDAPLAELGTDVVAAFDTAVRLRFVLGVDLATDEVLRARTVRELAGTAAGRLGIAPGAALSRPPPRACGLSAPSVAQELLILTAGGREALERSSERVAVAIRGPLDLAALAAAVEHVGHRHPALRTTLLPGTMDEPPAARFGPAARATTLDILPASASQDLALELCARQAARPFPLGDAPLLRASVTRVGDECHVLGLSAHRVVADARSLRVLLGELALLHDACAHGQVVLLPEPDAEDAGRVAAEQTGRMQATRQQSLSFWGRQWAGGPEAPSSRNAAPRRPADNRATTSFALRATLTEALRALCRAEAVSLHTLLFAATGVVLRSMTGRPRFAIEIVLENRPLPWQRHAVGAHAVSVPLRAEPTGEESFVELLRRTRRQELEAHAHTGPALLEALARTGGPLARSLDLALVVEPPPLPIRARHTCWDVIEAGHTDGPAARTLRIRERGGHLEGTFVSAGESPAAGLKWVRTFEALVGELVAAPEARLARIWGTASGPSALGGRYEHANDI